MALHFLKLTLTNATSDLVLTLELPDDLIHPLLVELKLCACGNRLLTSESLTQLTPKGTLFWRKAFLRLILIQFAELGGENHGAVFQQGGSQRESNLEIHLLTGQ